MYMVCFCLCHEQSPSPQFGTFRLSYSDIFPKLCKCVSNLLAPNFRTFRLIYSVIFPKLCKCVSNLLSPISGPYFFNYLFPEDRTVHLRTCLEGDHGKDEDTGIVCSGDWKTAAKEILSNNNIPLAQWQQMITSCLRMGRRKENNLFIFGPANCGKVVRLIASKAGFLYINGMYTFYF